MTLRPLTDRIAVRLLRPAEVSPSGIYLGPAPADDGLVKEIVNGEVLAVGPGRQASDMWGIERGQVIAFSPVGSATFEFEGEAITMIRRDAVVGVRP